VRVNIFYGRLLDLEGASATIGGVQTYLTRLVDLCISLGYETTVFQMGARDFLVPWRGAQVVGVAEARQPRVAKQVSTLLKTALSYPAASKAIQVFGADHFSVHTRNPRSLSIQHGVSWDLPLSYWGRNPVSRRVRHMVALWRARRNFDNCPNRVCVDHNFLNWYRTTWPGTRTGRTWVIPNSCDVPSWKSVAAARQSAEPGPVRILFARRFFDYRGTRLVAQVASSLLHKHQGIEFTFAGSGPDEQLLRTRLGEDPRVRFMAYNSDQAIEMHLAHDIAVVPSLGSEGTSFSVAEAMGSGCAVVATNVGGVTNMILDGYNGLLVMPEPQAVEHALERLILDRVLRTQLRRSAWETAATAFSLPKWQQRWRHVLDEVSSC
jgi:glycosyltransferase involved in cell wall biosynthesis